MNERKDGAAKSYSWRITAVPVTILLPPIRFIGRNPAPIVLQVADTLTCSASPLDTAASPASVVIVVPVVESVTANEYLLVLLNPAADMAFCTAVVMLVV